MESQPKIPSRIDLKLTQDDSMACVQCIDPPAFIHMDIDEKSDTPSNFSSDTLKHQHFVVLYLKFHRFYLFIRISFFILFFNIFLIYLFIFTYWSFEL